MPPRGCPRTPTRWHPAPSRANNLLRVRRQRVLFQRRASVVFCACEWVCVCVWVCVSVSVFTGTQIFGFAILVKEPRWTSPRNATPIIRKICPIDVCQLNKHQPLISKLFPCSCMLDVRPTVLVYVPVLYRISTQAPTSGNVKTTKMCHGSIFGIHCPPLFCSRTRLKDTVVERLALDQGSSVFPTWASHECVYERASRL